MPVSNPAYVFSFPPATFIYCRSHAKPGTWNLLCFFN